MGKKQQAPTFKIKPRIHTNKHESKTVQKEIKGGFKLQTPGGNGSGRVGAEDSTRGRVEWRPGAGALPKPFENTPQDHSFPVQVQAGYSATPQKP
jgi:hypothetical protein